MIYLFGIIITLATILIVRELNHIKEISYYKNDIKILEEDLKMLSKQRNQLMRYHD